MSNKENTMKIFHNPRCSKSRCAMKILSEHHVEAEVVKYLEDTPSKEEIKTLLKKLGMKAVELVRKGEEIYKEQYKGRDLSEEEWIDALVQHPKLIERPIFIHGDKAVIGRPPERILEIL